jgi:hypothetical protein
MAASADRVWNLVSDITRVGEFSPETFAAEWLGRTNLDGIRVTLEKIKAVIEFTRPSR